MPSKLDVLVLDRQRVATRPAATYADGATQLLFTIEGGPIWIVGFFMYTVLIQNLGTTMTVLCNNVALDAGAANMNTAAGSFWVWELQGAAAVTAVMTPMPQTAALGVVTGVIVGPAAANAVIEATIAGGFGGFTNPISFHCVYYAMTPASQLV